MKNIFNRYTYVCKLFSIEIYHTCLKIIIIFFFVNLNNIFAQPTLLRRILNFRNNILIDDFNPCVDILRDNLNYFPYNEKAIVVTLKQSMDGKRSQYHFNHGNEISKSDFSFCKFKWKTKHNLEIIAHYQACDIPGLPVGSER